MLNELLLSALACGMMAAHPLLGIETKLHPPLEEGEIPLPHSIQEVSVIGAPTSGPFLEGVAGSIQKGCRHRFYCHSASPAQGFLGPQTLAVPLSLKDQPGVFPAPSMGHASLTFSFKLENPGTSCTPIVVRPDGTVFHGVPMKADNSPQSLVISSPAQTGLYTLFILAHPNEKETARVTVEAAISTQPQQKKMIPLKTFDPKAGEPELISAEFLYIP